jgi:hypothetical protein
MTKNSKKTNTKIKTKKKNKIKTRPKKTYCNDNDIQIGYLIVDDSKELDYSGVPDMTEEEYNAFRERVRNKVRNAIRNKNFSDFTLDNTQPKDI